MNPKELFLIFIKIFKPKKQPDLLTFNNLIKQ